MGITIDHTTVVVAGCDVGKASHQIQVIDSDLNPIGRRKITNTGTAIETMLDWAMGLGDQLVLVLDQKGAPAARLVLAARRRQIPVLYVTGLQARRASDLTPGRAKTDRIDARVIAEFGRTHAHRLPHLEVPGELDASMRLLLGRDEDLRCDFNRTINRLRDLLVRYAPELEAALAKRLLATGVLAVLARWGNPQSLGRARLGTITKTIAAHNPRLAPKVAQVMSATAGLAPTQPGLGTGAEIISALAHQALGLIAQRAEMADRLADLAAEHPDYELLCTIPGMGPRTATRTLAELGTITSFPTGAHLASYAGLAPVNRQSGNSLNTVRKDRAGNHRLKNALFLSAFVATNHDPTAAACYQAHRARGKHHNAAIVCVARKRCDIIWAVLTNRTPYDPNHRKHHQQTLTK